MNRILLVFLTRPTLLGSIVSLLVAINPAQAAQLATQSAQVVGDSVCVRSVHTNQLVCVKRKPQASATPVQTANAQLPSNDNTPMLEFTDEESDAAITLFGCDCPACIRSLRQLRAMAG